MPLLHTGLASIFYDLWDGPESDENRRITLVNGYIRNHSDFRLFGRKLVKLGFTVLVLDNRGSGRSTVEGAFSFEDFADDIINVWNEIGWNHSDLLGVSMGGAIAQLVAAKAPSMIRRLILVSTAPDHSHIRKGSGWLFPVDGTVGVPDAEELDKRIQGYFAPDFVKKNKLLLKGMVKDFVQAAGDERFMAAAMAQRTAVENRQDRDLAGQIQARTLLVHGEEDRVIEPSASRELHKMMKDSELVLIPQAGHMLLAEQPARLLSVVGDFLAGD